MIAYSLFNDASIRDYQFKAPQWTVGKNFDNAGAFGPYLVTADELSPGCRGLRLETRLSEQVVQSASTNDLVSDIATLVSTLSEAFRWEPGGIIVTDTPSGVDQYASPALDEGRRCLRGRDPDGTTSQRRGCTGAAVQARKLNLSNVALACAIRTGDGCSVTGAAGFATCLRTRLPYRQAVSTGMNGFIGHQARPVDRWEGNIFSATPCCAAHCRDL